MRWFIILLFVLGTLFIACDTPTDTEPTPIADALKALETAYNNADLAAYKATLNADSYLFHFCEQDQRDWDAPETLSYTQDTNSTERMFADLGAENIELTFTLPEFEEPTDDVSSFILDEVTYYLTIDDFLSTQATCKFEMIKVDGNWLISDLWDYYDYYSGLCGIPPSWGLIKYIFSY